MNVRQKLSLAALCFTLPAMASAQAAAATAEAAPATATATATATVTVPAPAPAPAAPAVTITPYGFVNLAAFSNQGRFSQTDYAGQVLNEDQKAFIASARQSRFGFNVASKDGGFTGATLAAKIEADFAVGFLPTKITNSASAVANPTCTGTDTDADGQVDAGSITCTQGAVTQPSSALTTGSNGWHAGVVRLRYAFGTATWDFKELGKLTFLAGQTDGLVNALHPDSIAYAAFPMFWQAGNMFRRSPQLRATYDFKAMDMLSVQGAVALLSPADGENDSTTGAIDFGAGTKTGAPDVEVRVAATVKPMPDISATVGLGYHMNKRGYPDVTYTTDGATKDFTATMVGVDFDANITKYASLKGEWYTGKGIDDIYSGIISNAARDMDAGAALDMQGIGSTGFWAQLALKPIPEATILLGMGQSTVDTDDLAAKGTTAPASTTQREKNAIIHAGVTAQAGKNWRFGVEFAKTTTTYWTDGETPASGANSYPARKPEMSATQISVSSRFTF